MACVIIAITRFTILVANLVAFWQSPHRLYALRFAITCVHQASVPLAALRARGFTFFAVESLILAFDAIPCVLQARIFLRVGTASIAAIMFTMETPLAPSFIVLITRVGACPFWYPHIVYFIASVSHGAVGATFWARLVAVLAVPLLLAFIAFSTSLTLVVFSGHQAMPFSTRPSARRFAPKTVVAIYTSLAFAALVEITVLLYL
jgi:hypothetical protein